tara:strand:- start:206 stop:781 length:576 start_codon:yes stop_codon:yes gene_type:complete
MSEYFVYSIQQPNGTQDLKIEFLTKNFKASEFRVKIIDNNTKLALPTYDDEKQLNPSWTWYSDTCDNADGSAGGDNESSKGTIKIPNLTTGSKIVYLQAIPCDSSLSIKNEMGNVQITSWWRNTTEFFLITTFTVLLYAILAVIGLIGALRYQALEKDNSPRLVGNWIAFAFGIFVPLFQAVPIVNGFTAK